MAIPRRLLSPMAAAANLFPPLSVPKPYAHVPNPFLLLQTHRRFSTTPDPNPNTEEMRHQEIEGPTVVRDTSSLADETRRELDALRRAVHRLSVSLAVLSGAHLAAGAWIVSGAAPVGVESATSVQGVVAFAFPFTGALVLRRSIKPIAFFQKMEANARLQVLTLCLQATKNVNLMLLRTRVVAIACALGVSVGSVAAILMR